MSAPGMSAFDPLRTLAGVRQNRPMKTVRLEVSEEEFSIVLGALREACASIETWELGLRVGGDADAITRLSLKIREQGEAQGAVE